MDEVENHNSGQWLRVQHVADRQERAGLNGGLLRAYWLGPGWYVVRTCPCHEGQLVTRPYESEERADEVRRRLIEIAMEFGT